MKSRGILRVFGLLWACAIASGCADAFKAPYPAKAYFLVDPGDPGASGQARAAQAGIRAGNDDPPIPKRVDAVLTVRQLRVASPYDGSAFVYKIGPNQYSSDYYSAFLMPTGRMLSADTCNWLNRSNVFSHVVDSASTVRSRYSLEGNVSGLYGDFTNRGAPRAVVEAEFFLLKDGDSSPRIVFARSYSTSAPIHGNGPAVLVDAWNHAWRKMLEELTADLDRSAPVLQASDS